MFTSSRVTRRSLALAVVVCLTAASACSSDDDVAGTTGQVSGAPSPSAASADPTLAPTDPTGSSAEGGSTSGAAAGLGVTDDEIKIGISLLDVGDPNAFGNTQAQADAVVAHVNDNGGIAGRTVVPVYYTLDFTRTGVADGQSEQEACTAWTEDDQVFAVVNTVMARVSLLDCLAGRGVPGAHIGMPIDEQTLKPYRDYWYGGFGGTGLTLDRLASASTAALGDAGFFGDDAVVGILHYDDPEYERVVEEIYKPALAELGVTDVVTQAAPRAGEASFPSYVLAFQSANVSHVLFLGEPGAYAVGFMTAAETQQYRPSYGLTTTDNPAVGVQPAAPPAQLENVVGIGWSPIYDVDGSQDPGPVSETNEVCVELQDAAGEDMSNRSAQLTALSYCSGLLFLQTALASATDVTAEGLAAAVAELGTDFESPAVFGTEFSAERHDGVDAVRPFAFDAGCSCFAYTGDVTTLP